MRGHGVARGCRDCLNGRAEKKSFLIEDMGRGIWGGSAMTGRQKSGKLLIYLQRNNMVKRKKSSVF